MEAGPLTAAHGDALAEPAVRSRGRPRSAGSATDSMPPARDGPRDGLGCAAPPRAPASSQREHARDVRGGDLALGVADDRVRVRRPHERHSARQRRPSRANSAGWTTSTRSSDGRRLGAVAAPRATSRRDGREGVRAGATRPCRGEHRARRRAARVAIPGHWLPWPGKTNTGRAAPVRATRRPGAAAGRRAASARKPLPASSSRSPPMTTARCSNAARVVDRATRPTSSRARRAASPLRRAGRSSLGRPDTPGGAGAGPGGQPTQRQGARSPARRSCAAAGASATCLRSVVREHDMAVGAAHAERADAGDAAARVPGQRPPARSARAGSAVQWDRPGSGVSKFRLGGQLAGAGGQDDLEQPGDARPRPPGGRCWS